MKKRISIAMLVIMTWLLCSGFTRNAAGIPEAYVVNNSNVIIVGDSRMVLVHDAVGDAGCDWLATAGSGYNKLEEYSKLIDTMDLKGKKIIISYGINDINIGNPSIAGFYKYQNFMNTKAQEWIKKGASVYFTDIPQITPAIRAGKGCENTAVDLINEYVEQFNDLAITNGFPADIKHISLKIDDKHFYDGIHYDEISCLYVFNKMMSEIKNH